MSTRVLNNAELTSMILQWLKDITLEGTGDEEDNLPGIPSAQWTAPFARLATVNKTFFYGSVTVLWERLGSAMPLFGYVLPADRNSHGRLRSTLTYNKQKLTANDWDRFKLYATQVKVLVLEPSAQTPLPPGWLYQLLNTKEAPATLFPSLRRLFITSVDPLSLYIASNSIVTINFIKLNLYWPFTDTSGRESGRAIVNGLSQKAIALTRLQLVCPVNPAIIETISRIRTLDSLWLTIQCITGADLQKLSLDRLGRLPELQTLHIDQASRPHITEESIPIPDYHNHLQEFISRDSGLGRLVNLSVKAGGTPQLVVASMLLPKNLRSLILEVLPDRVNAQMFVLPSTLAIYSNRNRSLERLSVSKGLGTRGTSTTPEALESLRQVIPLDTLEPMFNGIAGLYHLRELEISGVPFYAVDIVPRLLNTVSNLPLLRILHIRPAPATALEIDEPIMPDLGTLQVLSRQLPDLSRLIISVTVPQELPALPAVPSSHALRQLGLGSSIDYAKFKAEDKFKLVRYLESLFPEVEMVTTGMGPEETEFWTSIDQLLSFSRDSRSRTLKEVENIMGI